MPTLVARSSLMVHTPHPVMCSNLRVRQFPGRQKTGGSSDVHDSRRVHWPNNAILHLQWLRTFLAETDLFRSPVTNIMADNQSAIALSRNPEFHKRTKHFNVKFITSELF